jgi:F0F1-type ATP synthase membrane subunit b/b'
VAAAAAPPPTLGELQNELEIVKNKLSDAESANFELICTLNGARAEAAASGTAAWQKRLERTKREAAERLERTKREAAERLERTKRDSAKELERTQREAAERLC